MLVLHIVLIDETEHGLTGLINCHCKHTILHHALQPVNSVGFTHFFHTVSLVCDKKYPFINYTV